MAQHEPITHEMYSLAVRDGFVYQEDVVVSKPSAYLTTNLARYRFNDHDLIPSTDPCGATQFRLDEVNQAALWLAMRRTIEYILLAMNGLLTEKGCSSSLCLLIVPAGYCRRLEMLPPTFPLAHQILLNPFHNPMSKDALKSFIRTWQATILRLQAWTAEATRRIEEKPQTAPFFFPRRPTVDWDHVAYNQDKKEDMESLVKQLHKDHFEYHFFNPPPELWPLPPRLFIAGADSTTSIRVLTTGLEDSLEPNYLRLPDCPSSLYLPLLPSPEPTTPSPVISSPSYSPRDSGSSENDKSDPSSSELSASLSPKYLPSSPVHRPSFAFSWDDVVEDEPQDLKVDDLFRQRYPDVVQALLSTGVTIEQDDGKDEEMWREYLNDDIIERVNGQ